MGASSTHRCAERADLQLAIGILQRQHKHACDLLIPVRGATPSANCEQQATESGTLWARLKRHLLQLAFQVGNAHTALRILHTTAER